MRGTIKGELKGDGTALRGCAFICWILCTYFCLDVNVPLRNDAEGILAICYNEVVSANIMLNFKKGTLFSSTALKGY